MELINKQAVRKIIRDILKGIEKHEDDNPYEKCNAYVSVDCIEDEIMKLETYTINGLYDSKDICEVVRSYAEGIPQDTSIIDKLNRTSLKNLSA